MRTILYPEHVAQGAKMVDFAGWEMPIQYGGIVHEHHVVREKVGLFDVSHMGCIEVSGPDAEACLDFLSTNQISGKKQGQAVYTVWANREGYSVDDVIVFCLEKGRFLVVVNAGNREKDLAHLKAESARFDVCLSSHYDDMGILAVQGPKSIEVVRSLFPGVEEIKFFRSAPALFEGEEGMLSRTGYTGETGVELYFPNQVLRSLWNQLLEKGKDWGIEPVGLGARDTLRLEMGFALYGHELSESISPLESVAAWTVRLKKESFLGKEAMERLERSGEQRYQVGLRLLDRGIAREGSAIFKEQDQLGEVTSGTQSPTLQKAIAIAMVRQPLEVGDQVEVEVRQRRLKAEVVPLPFVQLEAKV